MVLKSVQHAIVQRERSIINRNVMCGEKQMTDDGVSCSMAGRRRSSQTVLRAERTPEEDHGGCMRRGKCVTHYSHLKRSKIIIIEK